MTHRSVYQRKDIYGDLAVEVLIMGAIHDTHSTLAEPFEDLVVQEGLADHEETYSTSTAGVML
jgi:hypothetical protein